MITATCQTCGKPVYKAVNVRNGKTSEQFYSERILYRLSRTTAGTLSAVPVHGLYEVHRCGGRFVHPTQKARAMGRVNSARHHRKTVSSGRN